MQDSYDRLYKKYEQKISEAKELGIDFYDKNYDNILIGRRYELFVAKSLVKDNKFKILEWTPDKGFEANIPVKSNFNPDLVISDAEDRIIAIECKFRSKFFFKTKNNEISWSYEKQVGRYRGFSSERNIPVFIALGLFDEPTDPKYHYLVDMEMLYSRSRTEEVNSGNFQLIVEWKNIQNDYVRNGEYANYLEGLL